jgi:hypothetical protein
MSTKTDFTDAEWKAVTEAPLLITAAMFAAGQHGPISMVKESAASAKVITHPGNRGAASGLIAEIVPDAQSKESRHDAEHHQGQSIAALVDACLADLAPTAAALGKLPQDEAAGVAEWYLDIAVAVAEASKGVSDTERDVVGRVAELFHLAPPTV